MNDLRRICRFVANHTHPVAEIFLQDRPVPWALSQGYLEFEVPQDLQQSTWFMVKIQMQSGELSLGPCKFNHVARINPFFTNRCPDIWEKLTINDFNIDDLDPSEIEMIRKFGIFCPSGATGFDSRRDYRLRVFVNGNKKTIVPSYELQAGDVWQCDLLHPAIFLGPTPWAMADKNWNYHGR